jgi:hypothetical protein
MSKFVEVRMLDGLEWIFGPLAGVKRGFKARNGVPFSGRLSSGWVEIVKGIGRSIAYQWGDRVTMFTAASSSPREGQSDGIQ